MGVSLHSLDYRFEFFSREEIDQQGDLPKCLPYSPAAKNVSPDGVERSLGISAMSYGRAFRPSEVPRT